MAYITLFNLNSKLTEIEVDKSIFNQQLYKEKIYFFSYHESLGLLAFKEFLENPGSFIKSIVSTYKGVDTFTLVYENLVPKFHSNPKCFGLNSDYINFKIPAEIVDQGITRVTEFRSWFKMNIWLLENNYTEFLNQVFIKFCKISALEEIDFKNSSCTLIENLTVSELEIKINDLISRADEFLSRGENLLIALKYHQLTHLAYLHKKIDPGFPDYYDKLFRERLKYFNEEFKLPLKKYLINYFRITLNPELDIPGSYLEIIGFKKCKLCY